MKKNRELHYATVWGVLLVVLSPSVAHAYIDPGVGLLVLQGVFASAVGLLFFARRLVAQTVMKFFGKGSGPRPADVLDAPAPAPVNPPDKQP